MSSRLSSLLSKAPHMKLGCSFLFAEDEGEISSKRPLAGHSVLLLHNHRNPGASGDGLCAPNFCRSAQEACRLNGHTRACSPCPSPNTDRPLSHEDVHESSKKQQSGTQTNVCFLDYTPSSSYLLQWESYEDSSCPGASGLEFLLQEYLFASFTDNDSIEQTQHSWQQHNC